MRSARRTTCVFGDGPTRYPYDVRVARLRMLQGIPGEQPRYDSGEIYVDDPGEADGRIEVWLAV